MSTEASPSLTSSFLANLPPLPHVPGTEPERCILDSFRTAIAKLVSEALPSLSVDQVYTGVDYGKKGVDFTIALPRFRLPGKVEEHAKKVLEKVSRALAFTVLRVMDRYFSGSLLLCIPRVTRAMTSYSVSECFEDIATVVVYGSCALPAIWTRSCIRLL